MFSLFCMVALASMALAGSYELVRIPAPGTTTADIQGCGKVVQIEVYNSAVTTGTVTLSKIVPGSPTTNLQYTVTCASGTAVVALTSTNTFFLAGGDVVVRGGTATNGLVRLVIQ